MVEPPSPAAPRTARRGPADRRGPRRSPGPAPGGRRLRPRRRLTISRSWVVPSLLVGVVAVLVAGSAAAAIETDAVTSYPRGLWWAVSLITTVGFLGPPPQSTAGALLSVALMLIGFVLLAMVSAALAAMFVHEEEEPREVREEAAERATLEALDRLERRLVALEAAVRARDLHGSEDGAAGVVPEGPAPR